jgi:hypothetical protein
MICASATMVSTTPSPMIYITNSMAAVLSQRRRHAFARSHLRSDPHVFLIKQGPAHGQIASFHSCEFGKQRVAAGMSPAAITSQPAA